MKKVFKIGSRYVGEGQPCLIIAEGGVNHNGEPELAERLIKVAAEVGVDVVKFQKRTVKDILTKEKYDSPYIKPTSLGPTYGKHREKLELGDRVWKRLKSVATKAGLMLSGSAWDHKSADFLEDLDVPFFKIASADLTNLPLLAHIARKGRPVILSTGMSTLEEIDEAVAEISKHNDELILLHCVSTYPCDDSDANLRGIEMLRNRYDLPVGYSSHDKGVAISAVAVGLGACVIEKHFTLDRTMVGPDHAASLEPQGLEKMIKYIRHTESALGDGIKKIMDSEIEPRSRLAKSIVTKRNISKGTLITEDMLTVKCPGDGLKPKYISSLCGRIAISDIEADTLVPINALDWPMSRKSKTYGVKKNPKRNKPPLKPLVRK